MDKIVGLVGSVPKGKDAKDDDFADRLSNRYTVVIIVVFSVVVSGAMYVGSAITCWMPQHFTGSHSKFTNSYCWVKNTYYLPFDDHIPKADEPHLRQVIPYYQWIPFILLGQALLFYLPSVVWHGLNQKVGVDADSILEAASTFNMTNKVDQRDTQKELITNQFHRFLTTGHKTYYKGCQCNKDYLTACLCRPCGRSLGNFLTLLYMFSKVLYIGNVIGQLFLLNKILATEYSVYGLEVVEYLMYTKDWTEAPYTTFPRVTMCDFSVRRLGNVHRYTVQCTLPINMYNEKIYMFLWFWFVMVAVVSSLDLLIWLVRYCMKGDKVKFLKNHLTFDNPEEIPSKSDVERFLDEYLRQDGVFLLRLIAHNTNNLTTTEIVCSIFEKWKVYDKIQAIEGNSDRPPTAPSDGDGIALDDVDGDPEKQKLKKDH